MCLDPKTPYTDTPLNKWYQYFIENIIQFLTWKFDSLFNYSKM